MYSYNQNRIFIPHFICVIITIFIEFWQFLTREKKRKLTRRTSAPIQLKLAAIVTPQYLCVTT